MYVPTFGSPMWSSHFRFSDYNYVAISHCPMLATRAVQLIPNNSVC
jgi:hypothetical protein